MESVSAKMHDLAKKKGVSDNFRIVLSPIPLLRGGIDIDHLEVEISGKAVGFVSPVYTDRNGTKQTSKVLKSLGDWLAGLTPA